MRNWIGWLGTAACAALSVAAPAEAKSPQGVGPQPAAADQKCDPIDPSLCLLPWPNDFFTRPDPSTATGRRLSIDPQATPQNDAGTPVDPTDWNRLDGFSPRLADRHASERDTLAVRPSVAPWIDYRQSE